MHQVTILGEEKVDREAENGSTDEETASTPEDSRPGEDNELQYEQRKRITVVPTKKNS